MQDPEIEPSDPSSATPVPAVELFEQHQHSTHIGEELRALLTLAIPVVLSELGWMTMTIVDLIMVGRLGPDAIGAVGLGNAIYYAPSLFGIGLLLGLDTLVSQSWGAHRYDDCHRSLAQAMYIALAFTPVLMVFMLAAQWIFTGRGVDPTVAVLTRSYVGILNWGTLPLLVYGGFRRYLQGVSLVRPVAFALITANLINILSRQLQRTIVDKTGLTGKYDISLQWSAEEGQGTLFSVPPPPPPPGPSSDASGPSGRFRFSSCARKESRGLLCGPWP